MTAKNIIRFETIANKNQTWTKGNAIFSDLFVGFVTQTSKTPAVWLDYSIRTRDSGVKSVTIENVCCTDKNVGKGYGTALMTAFMSMIMDRADYGPVIIAIPNCNQYSAAMAEKLGFTVSLIEDEDDRYYARFEHKEAISTVTPAQVEAVLNTKEESPMTIETINARMTEVQAQIKAAKADNNTAEVARLAQEFNVLAKQKSELTRAAKPTAQANRPVYVNKGKRNMVMDYYVRYFEEQDQIRAARKQG